MDYEIAKIAELLESKFFSKDVEILAMKKLTIWSYRGGWHKGSQRQYKWLVLSRQTGRNGNVQYMTHDCLYWAGSKNDISTGDGDYSMTAKTYQDGLDMFEDRFQEHVEHSLINLSEKEIQEEEKRYK